MRTVLQFQSRDGAILASGRSAASPPDVGDEVSLDGIAREVLDVQYHLSTKREHEDRLMTTVVLNHQHHDSDE
jgi:hypothetical protein